MKTNSLFQFEEDIFKDVSDKDRDFLVEIDKKISFEDSVNAREWVLIDLIGRQKGYSKDFYAYIKNNDLVWKLRLLFIKYPRNLAVRRIYLRVLEEVTGHIGYSWIYYFSHYFFRYPFNKYPAGQFLNRHILKVIDKRTDYLKTLGFKDHVEFLNLKFDCNIVALMDDFAESLPSINDLYFNCASFLLKEKHDEKTELNYKVVEQKILEEFSIPDALKEIVQRHDKAKIAERIFNNLGFKYSDNVQIVNTFTLEQFNKIRNESDKKIFLDFNYKAKNGVLGFASPISIPGEIWVGVDTQQSISNYSGIFHELTHAFYFNNVTRNLLHSQKNMGSGVLIEAYSYLFTYYVPYSSHFLGKYMRLKEIGTSVLQKYCALRLLHFMRKYIILGKFGINLYRDDVHIINKLDSLKEMRKYENFSNYFKGIEHLCAIVLAKNLETYLRENYGSQRLMGEDWYENPEAGRFLREVWLSGNVNVKSFAKTLNLQEYFDIYPTLAWIVELLTKKLSNKQ